VRPIILLFHPHQGLFHIQLFLVCPIRSTCCACVVLLHLFTLIIFAKDTSHEAPHCAVIEVGWSRRISHQTIEQFIYCLYRQELSEEQLSGYSINTCKVHPASYPVGTGHTFRGVKRPGHEADSSPPTSAKVKNTSIRRSQWPRRRRRELCSLARTVGSWVRISLKAWMFVFAFILYLCWPVCR
jgi:hypothetical protein